MLTRRGVLATIPTLALGGCQDRPQATKDLEHDWVAGPFYVMAAGGAARVEHCRDCGILRLPESTRGKIED